MSPAAQHTALMESMGWHKAGYGWANGKESARWLPDLSLDLMASAEATLTGAEGEQYVHHLFKVISLPEPLGYLARAYFTLLTASKEQRLEAYLRTKGLYVP